MASLFQRSNGYYYLITSVNGRRVWESTGCRTKAEAVQYISEKKRKSRKTGFLTLGQFRTQFLAYAESNLSRSTVELYKSAFSKFIHLVGDFEVFQYIPQNVEQFKVLRSKEVSPVKVNIDFRCMRSAFNTALKWNLISSNPFTVCKQIRIPSRRPTYLSREEFHKILSVIDVEWFKEVIRFAVATMARAGEIVNLKWEAIDFPKRIIYIENSNGFRTKTQRNRVIPMDELLYHMLVKKDKGSSKVFTFPDGHNLSVGYISSRFKKYVRKAGVNEDVHFHTLRHTGATWLIQRNVPIYNVKQILGHSSIEMTEIYSHLEVDHLRKPLQELDSFING